MIIEVDDRSREEKLANLASRPGTPEEGNVARTKLKELVDKKRPKIFKNDPHKNMKAVAHFLGFKPHETEKHTVVHPSGWQAEFFGNNDDYFLNSKSGSRVAAGRGTLHFHSAVKTFMPLKEEAPANAVGGGNIAGVGIGLQGEPGVNKKRKKKILVIDKIQRRKLPGKN